MPTAKRTPARVLAPLALVAFALAFLVIIASGGGGDDEPSRSESTAQEQRDLELAKEKRRRQKAENRSSEGQGGVGRDVYVVKSGDTLGSIAEKTGVPVEKLQELNPELDPQALVSGQKIKLRE